MKNESQKIQGHLNAFRFHNAYILHLVGVTLALFYCAETYAQQDAMAVATVTNGSVASVTVTTGGSGYISPPNVAFSGGGGTGASAIAQVGGGSVTNIIVESPGSGYTNAPDVAIDPPPPPVTASFSANPTNGRAPLAVQFTDQSGGPVASWNWNFGDGASDTAQNPSHTYTGAGTYTVALTVTGSGGQTSSANQTITVTNPPPPVTASFSATPTNGQAPLAVHFTDQSSGPVTSWSWNFGDGALGTAQNPSHTYSYAGTYVATLTVTGSSGQTGSAYHTIAVTQPITPAVLSIAMIPKLTIYSEPWQVQEVEYTTSLTSGNNQQWVILTNVVTGTNPWVYVDVAAAESPRFYRVVTIGAPGPSPSRWSWINPGAFLMGSPVSEFDRSDDEGPQTQVTFTNGFWIGRFLVTQAEYLALIGTNNSVFTNDLNQPVEEVTWFDASNYCAMLTTQEQATGQLPPGYVYRLPTEAEWEYATRAGTTNRFFFGDDLTYSAILNYGWIQTNSAGTTHDVGQKLPNQWGLYDTSGNLYEWCADYYQPYPGGSVTNPISPSVSTNGVVMRGGSWSHPGGDARSAARNFNPPDFYDTGIGFRVVLAPPLK